MQNGHAMIAAAQEATAQRMQQALSDMSITTRWASSVSDAENALLQGDYFSLLIFLPFPGDGIQLALKAARHYDCAIILIGQETAIPPGTLERIREAGVLFLSRPLGRERLALAMENALCLHQRLRYLQQEKTILQQKMKGIHSVDRAKYLLMKTLGMTEPQAHRFIEKQAMDARQTKTEVAMRILKTYENT